MLKQEKRLLEKRLIEKGFEPTLKGFRYLVEYIIMREESEFDFLEQRPTFMVIAKKYNTNFTSVERCMRHQFERNNLRMNKIELEKVIRELRDEE